MHQMGTGSVCRSATTGMAASQSVTPPRTFASSDGAAEDEGGGGGDGSGSNLRFRVPRVPSRHDDAPIRRAQSAIAATEPRSRGPKGRQPGSECAHARGTPAAVRSRLRKKYRKQDADGRACVRWRWWWEACGAPLRRRQRRYTRRTRTPGRRLR